MIREYINQGLTYDEIIAKVQEEFNEYKKEQAATEALTEAREAAVEAVIEYIGLINPDATEEELEEIADHMIESFVKVEKQVTQLKKLRSMNKPKVKVRELSSEDAERMLRDFLKGLN